jgi:hypothetical protein
MFCSCVAHSGVPAAYQVPTRMKRCKFLLCKLLAVLITWLCLVHAEQIKPHAMQRARHQRGLILAALARLQAFQIKILLLRAIVRPILTFGMQAWGADLLELLVRTSSHELMHRVYRMRACLVASGSLLARSLFVSSCVSLRRRFLAWPSWLRPLRASLA